MKRFTFVFTLALLARLNVSAGTVPISANYSLLGSQWSDNETFIHYTTGYSPFSAENDDQILSWHVITQQFFPADAYFHVGDPALNGWYDQSGTSSDLSPLPRGYAFFYFRASTATSFTPPLISPVTVVPKTLQSPNAIYFLSSQLAVTTPGSYQDLVGGSTVLNNRTFVWTWDAAHQTFGEMFRFRTGSGWKRLDLITLGNPTVAAPSVPAGLGAVVGWFQGGPAPCLLSVVVSAGACPPDVTLHLTFDQPLDPLAAANPANYTILKGTAGTVNGALLVGVTLGSLTSPNGLLPTGPVEVDLNVKLLNESDNVYRVNGKSTLTGLGGTPVSPACIKTFNPFCSGVTTPLPNDAPASASPLALTAASSFAATVDGSLTCANNTLLGGIIGDYSYPNGGGAGQKDLWYSVTPEVSGNVTVDTCGVPAFGCLSDTVLAIYQGFPGALYPIAGIWQNDNDAVCSPRSMLTFAASACTTYYVRVSGKGTFLPGGFRLRLQQTPSGPPNTACATATVVPSANRSTPFTVPAGGSVWFRFTAPLGAGPWLTEIDTCNSTISSAVSVFSGACPGTPVIPTLAMSCPATPFTFMAAAGVTYRVRVDNLTATDGCGFLHIASGIPALGTIPPAGTCITKNYTILGTGTGATWDWSLTAPPPCSLNIQGTATTLLNDSADQIAEKFAVSINNNFYNTGAGVPISATHAPVSTSPQRATLSICIPSPCVANGLVLKVGPVNSPNCWVNLPVLTAGFGPCNFNPDIFELGDPDGVDEDCNANGRSDYLDILAGTSTDANGDGIPDECQGCVGVVIADGPESATGNAGGTVTLVVHPIGTSPFSYQWHKGGVSLFGQTGATLRLTNLSLDAAGLYDVIVTNACGQATSLSAVLVVDPQPALNIATAGTNVVLSWNTADFHLQASPALGAFESWTNLTATSPVTISISAGARYFRLRGDD